MVEVGRSMGGFLRRFGLGRQSIACFYLLRLHLFPTHCGASGHSRQVRSYVCTTAAPVRNGVVLTDLHVTPSVSTVPSSMSLIHLRLSMKLSRSLFSKSPSVRSHIFMQSSCEILAGQKERLKPPPSRAPSILSQQCLFQQHSWTAASHWTPSVCCADTPSSLLHCRSKQSRTLKRPLPQEIGAAMWPAAKSCLTALPEGVLTFVYGVIPGGPKRTAYAMYTH